MIREEDYIFIPIGDNENESEIFSTVAGKHWTLLIYEKKKEKFIYFDSDFNGTIKPKIYTIAKRVKSLIKND